MGSLAGTVDPLGAFESQAFVCTDQAADPVTILRLSVCRWSVEVTFTEVRWHLGVETQRQWSDLAIARTTAYSGDRDRLVQPMVITHSGDRDHLQHVAQRGAAGRMAAAGRCC